MTLQYRRWGHANDHDDAAQASARGEAEEVAAAQL